MDRESGGEGVLQGGRTLRNGIVNEVSEPKVSHVQPLMEQGAESWPPMEAISSEARQGLRASFSWSSQWHMWRSLIEL